MQDKNNLIKNNRYALRKFKSAGLASALIGVSTISFLITNSKPVKASINNDPNEESNNDALKKEQEQDLQSGEKHETIERIHQSKTQVTKLPQHKNQEENKQETQTKKQDDIQSGTTTTTETRQAPTTKVTPLKPKKQTDKQEPAKEQTKPEKQAQTAENKTPVEKQPNKNGSETKKQQKEDSKNILKDLTETNAKLHQSLTNIKSNDDSSVDPIATETSDDAKQTATQKPVKIDLETQDFVLPRKRVSRLGVNMLAMNLAAMPAEQHNPTYPKLTKDNWKDPASWGMIKSNAGWTYSVPKYVADSSQSYFCDVNKNKFEGENVIGLKDQPATYRTHLSADISTDTANESVNQDVLVASMPILNNDPMTGTPGHTYFIPSFGFKFNMNHGVYDQKGNYIGYLWYNVEKNNDMKIYWRNTGKNYSDKVHIDFDFDSVNMDKGWPDNYQHQAKTGKEFDIEFVNPDGTFSNWREVYNPAQDDHPWQDNTNSLNVYVASPSPYWRNAYLNVGLNQSLDKADVNQSTFKKVEQVYAYDTKGNIVKINSASNAPHFRTYSKITDGTNTFSGYRYDLYTLGMTRLADNLSAQEVYDQTPAHSVSYSAQSDGSILMGYNFTLSDAHYSEQNVRDTVESEYYFNYQHPEEKQKWIDATIAAMKKRNWTAPNVGDIETYLNWNSDNVTTMSSLDVTPGISGQLQTSRSEENAGGSEAAYQQMATINFIDDDDNGKVISHQLIAGPQDKTKTFTTNVPDRYVLSDPSQYTISHHFVYKDNSVINIHVKHKIIGNVSDLHENAHNERDYFIDQVRSKADPNITIIHDQDKDYQAKHNDVNDQNNKINQISQDYINQTTTIANQIEDYNKKLTDYNTKKQDFIESLKKQGLWSDGMVDPTSVKQSLHLDLNGHNNSIRPTVTILDSSDVHLDNSNHVIFDTDNTVSGAFARAEYDGITNSYYRDTPISKMIVTLSNVKKGAKSANGYISVDNGINNGIWRQNIVGADLDIQFYDNNGNLITFGDDAYLTVSSLNGRSNGNGSTAGNTEAVKLLSDGQAIQLPQSGVKVHSDGGMYMDGGHDSPESLGLPSSLDAWDNSTSPSRIFGSAMIHVKGNHIKLRSYDYSDYTTDHNVGTGPWFIWSTMLPPIAFDQQPPKLELHYHNDNLQLTKTSTYQVIEKMPSPKYGKDQTILKTTITAGKDIARDLVTGETQETQFTGRNTHGNVDIGQTDGVDQTVIWGKQPTITGYHFNPFQAETKEHFDHVGGTDWTDHGAILSVSSTDNTIHFDYLVGQNYQSATDLGDSLILSDLPDSQTWYVTLSPNQQNTQVIYVDDDANGKQVGSQAISGLTDQETDHVFLDQFDHSKYTIDGNHLSKSAIQSDQLDGSITSYNVYEQTSPDYANYNFVNIYNKHDNQWTNVTSDPNNRLIIHLKEKTIGTTDPGNIIDPIHNLKGENVGPNITWIQDPNRETVVNDDQAAIDNALNNIANDYNTQEESIRNQLKDYYNRLDEYNQRRQDFIKDLKAKGYWNDSYIDLTNAGQHLQLDHDENNVIQIESLDPNFATVNGHMINVKPNVDHQGEFAKVTYTNLSHAFYDNKPISKIEVYYGDWYYSNMSDRDYCGVLVGSDLAGGYTFNHSTGLRVRIKLFNQNGNQIKLDKQSFLTLGSLNSGGPGGIESVKLLSKGKAYAIPGSSVTVHDGNWLYSDQANGTWNGVGGWDTNDPTDPKYSIGAGLFDITGDTDIIIHDYSGDVTNVHNRNSGVGAKWATTLTTIPPMAFEEKAPTLTIHYHENRLKTDFNRHYTINYVYPNDVQDYYDNYNNIGYVHANRYAGRNLVTNHDSYSNYNIDKSLNLNMNSSKALDLNWQQIYGYNIKSDIPDQNILNNHTSVAYTKDHQAFNGNVKNLADDFNYNVYYTPGQVQGKVKFVDEDTGELVQTNDVYGYLDQSVDISYIPIPRGYQIAPDSEKPDKFTFHPSDNMHPDQSITIYVVQATRTVQDIPRTIHVIVNNHPDLNSDITFTRKGEYNEHTGQTKWQDWLVDQAHGTLKETNDSYDLDGSSVTNLDQYNLNYKITLNNNQIKSGTLNADNSDLSLSINPNDSHFNNATNDLTYVIDLNQTPAIKQQYIIYEDRETHRELGNDSIIGPIGSSQRFTLQHFDGYKDPTNIPSTLTIKSDDTPYVIYLDKLAIFVPHNNPVKNGDRISNYTNEYTGDDTFPYGLDKDDLNHPVREIVNITKNGETHTTIHTLYFSRDAYYYPANGAIRYTDWQSEQTFDSVPLDHDGVTPIVVGGKLDANNNIAPVTVNANSQDVVIDVSYEKDDKGITLVWDDINMSNREIKRINMSLEDFKNNSHPEKTVLPDFRYIDEAHPETVNNYVNDITYTLSDSDGNVLSSGNVKDLNKAKALLHEKNHGYLLVFSNQHAYQTLHANANDQDALPPFKSTYRTVHVHLPNGLTYKFRFGIRWKLSDRNQDLVTGLKKALNTDILYEPVSYSGITDPEYPEITKESVISMLANYGLTNLKLDNYDMQISGDGSGKAITASSPNQDVNVTFLGHHVQTKVELVDISSGKVVAFNYLSGRIGQTINIPYPDLPSGYVNAGLAHYPKTYTFTSNTPEPVIVRVAKVKGNDHNSIPIDPDLNMSGKGMTSITKPKEHAVSMFTSSFMAIPSSPKFDDVKLAMPNLQSHITQTRLNSKQREKRIIQKAPAIKVATSHVTSAPQIKRNTTSDPVKSQNTKPIISQASNANFVPTNNKPITKQMAHDQALNAQLFTSDTNKPQLNKSNQDLLNKLSNLNTKPTYNSLSADNQVQIASKHELANKLNTLSKVKPVTHKVNAATNVTNNKENTKAKTDNSQNKTKSNKALVASLLGLTAGTSAAGVSLYKKKYKHLPNSNDTFNK